jgi:uncharacterized protein (TIGR03435 family)
VTGSDLGKRIEAIMTDPISLALTPVRKLLLAAAGLTVVAGPVLIGILNAPPSRAQSKTEAAAFEVASIRPADPDAPRAGLHITPGGGLNAINVNLTQLITFAYNIACGKNCDNFVSGGPAWIDSQRFDVHAKATQSDAPGSSLSALSAVEQSALRDQIRQRLRTLLAERFQLLARRATKEMAVFNLVVSRNGHKLRESAGGESGGIRGERGAMIAENSQLHILTINLAAMLGRPVLDKTGLTSRYDFRLEWAPDSNGGTGKAAGYVDGQPASSAGFGGPSIFTAIQEQLGLKLESTRGPVDIIVIDRLEKPSEN